MGRKYIDGILSQTGTPSANNDLTTKQYVDTQIASFKPFSYIVSSTASNTPQGIIWYNGTTQITGTLVASTSTEYTIYLVPCKHTATETQKGYDEYLTVKNESTYSWEVLGNTADIDLSEIADANIKTSQISNSRLFNNSLEGVINTSGSNYATIDGPKAEITNWSILNATFGDDADFESAEVTISDPTTKKNPVSLGYLETNYTTKTYVDGEVDTLFEEITNETDRATKEETAINAKIPSAASSTNLLADRNWVTTNAGKIDSISVEGTAKTISNKNVNLTLTDFGITLTDKSTPVVITEKNFSTVETVFSGDQNGIALSLIQDYDFVIIEGYKQNVELPNKTTFVLNKDNINNPGQWTIRLVANEWEYTLMTSLSGENLYFYSTQDYGGSTVFKLVNIIGVKGV